MNLMSFQSIHGVIWSRVATRIRRKKMWVWISSVCLGVDRVFLIDKASPCGFFFAKSFFNWCNSLVLRCTCPWTWYCARIWPLADAIWVYSLTSVGSSWVYVYLHVRHRAGSSRLLKSEEAHPLICKEVRCQAAHHVQVIDDSVSSPLLLWFVFVCSHGNRAWGAMHACVDLLSVCACV